MSLQIKNVTAGYGKTPVLHEISFEAKAGELIGLVGPNGAGKSLLLKIIAGLLPPLSGEIQVGTKPLPDYSSSERAQTIAWLDQKREAAWGLTAGEIIALGRAPYRGALGRLSGADKKAIDTAMHRARCQPLADHVFADLSGGEQARILLARTLAVAGEIILADEPLASLDPRYRLEVMDVLGAEAKAGKTIIVSLHDLAMARQFCPRIIVLDHGRVVSDGPPEQALDAEVLAKVFAVRWIASDLKDSRLQPV